MSRPRRVATAALRSSLGLLVVGGWLVTPTSARADGPADGRLIVTADFVLPGQPMPVTGDDLVPGEVDLVLAAGRTTASLGTAVVAEDGSMRASVPVPATYPHGYAELTARGAGGSWSTIVLIGPRAEGPGVQAATPAVDTRLLGLLALVAGAVVFLVAGARYVRR